jgi:4-deoxy-L-threo-5-hexosulose-uronate ketol-isomerase
MMEVRHAIHPEHSKALDTEGLRREFLVRELFLPGRVRMVYSEADRIIVGGVCPISPLELQGGKALLGSDTLLERRELGVINVGGAGAITVDGVEHRLDRLDGLYVGMGAAGLRFASAREDQPARFYLNCATAHRSWPTTVIPAAGITPARLGSAEQSNQREIFKYIHPDGVRSCQLVMGRTRLHPGSVWNTMPCHTHVRRMEVYFYFDLAEDAVVFHLTGEPAETRHLVVRSEEAVICPSWSVHSGVGTRSYSFVWGMAGENQAFDDMDPVAAADLR